MDKKEIIRGIIKELERQKSEIDAGLRSTKQAAKDSPSAMESHSDTTRNQMQTLARNLKTMAEEKEAAIVSLKRTFVSNSERFGTAKEGAVVETEFENGEKKRYLIVPEGGAGVYVDENGVQIISITLGTPLGAALVGKKTGEFATLVGKNGERKIKILDIF